MKEMGKGLVEVDLSHCELSHFDFSNFHVLQRLSLSHNLFSSSSLLSSFFLSFY